MARKPKQAVAIGHNSLSEIEGKLVAWRDKYLSFEKKRAELNAELAAVRTSAEAAGIPKKSFAAALAYFKEDPEKRKGFDNGYVLARKAFGLPIKGAQLELNLDTEGEVAADEETDIEEDDDADAQAAA